MHAQQREYPGFPADAPQATPVQEPGLQVPFAVHERARLDLAEAAARVPRIADAEDRLAGALDQRLQAITPRDRYGLFHGELGPDHVLLTRDTRRPIMIDIEGVHFTDVEYEHVFLELRFAGW